MHARWAYFFGPGCEPGLAELDRVVRRGGTALIIDNDGAALDLRRLVPPRLPAPAGPAEVERFWSERGWTRRPVDMGWRFEIAADLEAVVRIEFNPRSPTRSSPTTTGTEVDYAVNLWSSGLAR